MRRGGVSGTEKRTGTDNASGDGARAELDAVETHGQLSEALEELRVAGDELRHQERLLDVAGAEVAAQMQRYRALFDFAPDGYLVTRDDGVIEQANLAAMRMLGVHAREVIGKPLVVYVAATDRRRLMRVLREAARTTTDIHETELLLHPHQGEVVPVSCRVAAESGEGRPQLRWLLHDITRRRDAEQRLEEALRREQDAAGRLRELDAVKNAFLLAVSHDLRGPVNAIVELAGLLAAEPPPTEERRRRTAASIVANAAVIERIQRNLVDLDRLARHAVALSADEVDVPVVVAARVAAADGSDRSVNTHVEVPRAMLDSAVLERVLDNLLSNAMAHTPAGTPVDVSVRHAPQSVLVSVADRGRGVPRLLRRAIFEPFGVAVPGQNGNASAGVGVGLHLVSRFAELHGGRAWVEETPGGGATFRVLLRELC